MIQLKTPFTAAQLKSLLISMTPEQLEQPLWVFIRDHVLTGKQEICAVSDSKSELMMHMHGVVSELKTTESNLNYWLNQFDNEGRN